MLPAPVRRPSAAAHVPSATVRGEGLAARLGAAWRWRPPCMRWCRTARRMPAPNRRGAVRPAEAPPGQTTSWWRAIERQTAKCALSCGHPSGRRPSASTPSWTDALGWGKELTAGEPSAPEPDAQGDRSRARPMLTFLRRFAAAVTASAPRRRGVRRRGWRGGRDRRPLAAGVTATVVRAGVVLFGVSPGPMGAA